ncbi:MAG: hypothetical protein IJ142_04375 [Bacteroidaceae bacterium]|nr:hypothetical protein [Bacteroidaceae bacterium]
MKKIKKYCKDNIRIKITDFELLDVSIYGCDARFEFEIRDNKTDVLLDTDYETIDYAFMGVDDGEEIYYFLENDTYPGYHGKVGDVLYSYDDVFGG